MSLTRALPFLYLLPVGVVAVSLAAVGYLIDRVPLVPASLSRAYQRALLGLLTTITVPLDGWADRRSEAPVGEPVAESAP